MKRLIIIAAFSVALVSGVSKTNCDQNVLMDCGNCTTLIMCSSNTEILLSIKCPASAPYCNNGQCGSEASVSCAVADVTNPSLLCPTNGSPGYYPNPRNCYKYNYCDENKQATSYSCPGNYVFSRKTGGCKVKASNADCPTVICSYYSNKFLSYPADNKLYWYCSGSITMLLQCNTGQEFDSYLGKCTSDVCTTNGIISYTGDTSKYYLCIELANGQFKKYLQQCPNGLVYNGVFCDSATTSTTSTTEGTTITTAATTQSTSDSTTISTTDSTSQSTPVTTTTASTTASTTLASESTTSSTSQSTPVTTSTASTTVSTNAPASESTIASTSQSTPVTSATVSSTSSTTLASESTSESTPVTSATVSTTASNTPASESTSSSISQSTPSVTSATVSTNAPASESTIASTSQSTPVP